MRPMADLRFVPLSPEPRTGHRLAKRRNHQLSRAAEDFWNTCLAHPHPKGQTSGNSKKE